MRRYILGLKKLAGRKMVFRIALFFAVALLGGLLYVFIASIEKSWPSSTRFSFNLPFPAEIETRYDIFGESASYNTSRVYLSGPFNSWAIDDERYLMKRSDSGRWGISLDLYPGQFIYKYVVHVRDAASGEERVFWVHDENAAVQIDDDYGGYNSVKIVEHQRAASSAVRIIFIILLSGIFLYSIGEPAIGYLMAKKLSVSRKLFLSAIFLGLLSNFSFLFVGLYQQRQQFKASLSEQLALVHLHLQSAQVNFGMLSSETEKIKTENALFSLLYGSRTGARSCCGGDGGTSILAVAVFDSSFRPAGYVVRDADVSYLRGVAHSAKKSSVEDYLSEVYFRKIIDSVRLDGEMYGPVFMMSHAGFDEAYGTWITRFFLGSNQAVFPVIFQGRVSGYYAVAFSSAAAGGRIARFFAWGVAMLPVFLVFYYLLMTLAGRVISRNMKLLLDWTGRMRSGDLSSDEKIESSDEIQELAENFSLMRQKLRENFERIEKQNCDLIEMKNSLELKVAERTVKLEGAMALLAESNHKLEELSVIDPLTQLYNRRFFGRVVEREYGRARRENEPLSVILLDLDDFKKLNDECGHLVGDEALVATGKALKSIVKRSVDVCARYGGEEFIVLLPQTDTAGAACISEMIRAAVEGIQLSCGWGITSSVGVYTSTPGAGETVESMISKADRAMYRAKKEGKNRVCLEENDQKSN